MSQGILQWSYGGSGINWLVPDPLTIRSLVLKAKTNYEEKQLKDDQNSSERQPS